MLGEAAIRLSALLIITLVARGMGAGAVGLLMVAFGALMVGVPLLASGQVEVLIRECAKSPGRARSLLVTARQLQRRVELALVPLALVAALLVADSDLRKLLVAFVPYLLLRVEIFTRGAVFKGLDRMDVEVKARGCEFGVALVLTALLAVTGAPVWTVGLALTAGAGIGVLWLVKAGGRRLTATTDLPGVRWAFAHGAPFVGVSVGLQLLLRSDVLIAKGVGVADGRIGHYGASAGLVWAALVLPQLVAIALYPTLSRAALHGARPGMMALVAGGVGTGIGIVLAGFLWLGNGTLLVVLFGEEFRGAGVLLGRLAWALPGASASMILGVVLASWGRQNLGLIVVTAAALASILSNLYLIPRLGMAGAAQVAVLVHSVAALGNFAMASWPGQMAEKR